MISWPHYDTGNHRISCPSCGRGERDKTLGLTIEEDGKGVAHCFRCSFTESYRPDRGSRQQTPVAPRIKATATRRHETLSDYGHELWSACKPLSGAAVAYLEARHCHIPPADGDLRFHSALKHPTGYTGPSLVGLITDAVTREPLSLHRTWIQADGRKADVDPPRLLLGGHRKQGGVIRLWPDEAVTTSLGTAEGLETALSLAWAHAPVWACIDAGNLAALPYLAGIECLVIGADNDPAGTAAAKECAQRWADAGAEVYATRQTQNDLNDILKEAA
ncbi:Toprim domain protein [compost metagenome]